MKKFSDPPMDSKRVVRRRETVKGRLSRRRLLSRNERKNKSGHYIPPERSLLGKTIVFLGQMISRICLKVKYHNRDRIPRSLPYVLAANHVTFVDGMWIFNGLPASHFKRTCAMAGADLRTDYGLFGKIIFAAARAIPVERKGNPVRSLIVAKNTLLSGQNILIHPEGTRSSDGNLAELQSGSVYIAQKCNAPIVPVYISGGFEVWPRQQKWPSFKDPASGKKRRVDVYFLSPIYPSDYHDTEEIKAALSSALLKKERKEKMKRGCPSTRTCSC